MNTRENINYNQYTRLPCRTLMKADEANPVVEVITPHKGVVFVEIKEVDKGMFRKATEIDKKTDFVMAELWKLEDEAKDYLLSKWTRNEIVTHPPQDV
jgi:hypothetical protein